MGIQVTKACGLDIHKKFIVATIIDNEHCTIENRFNRVQKDLLNLKEWILENRCDVVACESTSDYWLPIYEMLENRVKVIVGNARDIKAISHKKTDKVDSAWIAKLALHNLIPASRIPDKESRELRSLIRLRKTLVGKRTDIKNEIHYTLDSCLFRLSSVLTDIFGKSGMIILSGVTSGKPISEILADLPTRMQKHVEKITEVLETNLPQTAIIRIKCCLDLIKELDSQIGIIMQLVSQLVANKKHEIRILTSVPGVGYLAAVTLIAEIGDFKDFPSGDKLASWLGIVPKVYQSADHLKTGAITKRGSKVARWILIQVANAAARSKNTKFGEFFNRKIGIIGFGKTIVALARKIVIIIWHLMINNELYEETEGTRKMEVYIPKSKEPKYLSLDEILDLIRNANIYLKESDPHRETG